MSDFGMSRRAFSSPRGFIGTNLIMDIINISLKSEFGDRRRNGVFKTVGKIKREMRTLVKGRDKTERIRERLFSTKTLFTQYVQFVLGWAAITIHTHTPKHTHYTNRNILSTV